MGSTLNAIAQYTMESLHNPEFNLLEFEMVMQQSGFVYNKTLLHVRIAQGRKKNEDSRT